MIELRLHFFAEYCVKLAKVSHESCQRVDLSLNSHVAKVAVAVIMRTRAKSESSFVTLVTPLGTAISVRGRKGDATRK